MVGIEVVSLWFVTSSLEYGVDGCNTRLEMIIEF